MLSIDISCANQQAASPLFNRTPAEIRHCIFNLAVTTYNGKKEPFAQNKYYYRPCFRYGDQKMGTALLQTCRRIYQETQSLPARNFVRVEWHGRGPPNEVRYGGPGGRAYVGIPKSFFPDQYPKPSRETCSRDAIAKLHITVLTNLGRRVSC